MSNPKSIRIVFGEEHVSRLTGLSIGQLRAWDKRGFFTPDHAHEDRRVAYSRVYSFRDIVGLRTLAVLLKKHHVAMAELRRTADRLAERGYSHWAEVTLYVVNRQVHFRAPGSDSVEGLRDGQLAMLAIIDVINDVEDRVQAMLHRTPQQYGRVEQSRHVMRNAPVIAGTRIPTAAVRRFSEAGYSVAEIIRQYPTLTPADVEGALAFEHDRNEEGLARSA